MPSGPPELHRKWKSDLRAQEYLRAAGYKLTSRWEWVVPPGHTPTPEECEAIDYLVLEWDFGGLRPTNRSQGGGDG